MDFNDFELYNNYEYNVEDSLYVLAYYSIFLFLAFYITKICNL